MGSGVSTNSHDGAFALGDDWGTSSFNDADNQMMMRFVGGYKLYTNGGSTLGVMVSPGGTSWSSISDKRKKENFLPVNGEEFLNKISKFELTSWNYKTQDPKLFRHYGPMAQDFYAAFGQDKMGVIGNDTTIAQADMEGVSFIAVQALENRTSNQQKTIEAQSKKINELENKMTILLNRLNELENK